MATERRDLGLAVLAILAFSFGSPLFVHAQTFVPLAPIPGLDTSADLSKNCTTIAGAVSSCTMANFLNNLYIFAIGIAVTLAVFMIVYGGVEYALSEAITNKAEGKRKIVHALYGLVIVLAPALVFSIVNPQILNLSVNFPPLSTQWGTYTPALQADNTPTPPSGALPGQTSFGEFLFPCTPSSDTATGYVYSSDNCASAIVACKNYGGTYQNVRCMSSDGSLTGIGGRADSFFNPFSDRSCNLQQTLQVTCKPPQT